MSVVLLDKIRKLNNLLHSRNNAEKVVFSDICKVLGEILNADVFVLSRRGKTLGISLRDEVSYLPELMRESIGELIDPALNERFLFFFSTKENVNLPMLGFEEPEAVENIGFINPINIAGERHGTLFLYRRGPMFGIDDIILCEYATTVIGLELMRSVNEESAAEVRNRQVVRAALNSMSISEIAAAKAVASGLKGVEGVLIASRIADESKITRSIIVNALRKLSSGGIIEARSSGMKGTYVKVINPYFFDILDSMNVAESEENQ